MFWISLHFQPYILVRTIGTFQIHEIFHQITLESTSDLLGLQLYIFVISALMKFFRLHFTQLSLIIETKIKCKYLKSPWGFLDKREVSPVWLWQTWPKILNPKANLQFYWLIKAFLFLLKTVNMSIILWKVKICYPLHTNLHALQVIFLFSMKCVNNYVEIFVNMQKWNCWSKI